MTHRATILGRGYDRQLDSPRVRFRRAILLCLMTIVVPGSAQIAVGNKWIGRLAVLLWLGALGGLGWLAWTARIDRAKVLGLVTDTDALMVARLLIIGVAGLWLLLFLDAWRLAHPARLNFTRAAVVTLVNTAIVVGVAGSAAYASQVVHVQRTVVKKVFTAKKVTQPLKGRFNILLLGGDSGKGRTGLRPDSMTVASVDADTGKTVLISLPRNLQNAPFRKGSPMRTVYPNGFNCGSVCLLNAVHTYAANRKDLYPHSKDPGLSAQIDAIEGVTGLTMNYYILVNMKGFSSLVDAVGGVTVDVKTRIAMFGHDDTYVNKYIEPGKQKLNGKEALWYGRSRVQSDDYVRMARQKCLMSDMLHQLSPQTVLTHATKILESGQQLISTSIPASELGKFADLALKSRTQPVSTLGIVPPAVDVVNPDFGQIHSMIKNAITKSEKTSAAAKKKSAAKKDSSQADAISTSDLASTC